MSLQFKISNKDFLDTEQFRVLFLRFCCEMAEQPGYPFTVKSDKKVIAVCKYKRDHIRAYNKILKLYPKLRFLWIAFRRPHQADDMVTKHKKIKFTRKNMEKLTDKEIREYCRQRDYPLFSQYKGADLIEELMKWRELAAEVYAAFNVNF